MDLLAKLNDDHRRNAGELELDARIASYELAARIAAGPPPTPSTSPGRRRRSATST